MAIDGKETDFGSLTLIRHDMASDYKTTDIGFNSTLKARSWGEIEHGQHNIEPNIG